MKLIVCLSCSDVFSLRSDQTKTCVCGKSGGKYIDDLNAEYWGECAPLGFANGTVLRALAMRDKLDYNGPGELFTAFVIPDPCPTMTRVAIPEEPLPEIKGRTYTPRQREAMKAAFATAVQTSTGQAKLEMRRLQKIFLGLLDDADKADVIITDLLREQARLIMERQ